MRIQRASVMALTLLGALGPGCSDDDASDGPLLVVQAASEQPGSDELGVMVAIQSRGGRWLEVEVSGGTLLGGGTDTCVRAPTAGSLRENVVNVLVFPARVEAVVTVRLLPDGERIAQEGAGAGQAGIAADRPEAGPCRIDAAWLKQVIKPVQRVAPVPPATGNAGGSGTGATASSGGAAGSPSTSGGAAGSGEADAGGSSGVAGAGGAS
jgi:hypothetical protein